VHYKGRYSIEDSKSTGDVRHRNSNTVALDDTEMAKRVFDRIKEVIPEEVWDDEECDNDGLSYNKTEIYGK
jgi:hypothetical protein